MAHRRDEAGSDSPAVRLLDALRVGDLPGVLAVCGDNTTVSAVNMAWCCTGRDQIRSMLLEARERFPGLTFESRTRHVGFGLVIDEARVRDVGDDVQPAPVGTSDGRHAAEPPPDSELAIYDDVAGEHARTLTVWRDQGDGPPAPLNMPVRVAIRHDDLQVHEVSLSFPAALLKRALGMRVDPFEISLSEVQSAFISPVDEGFTTHTLARPEMTLVPTAPVDEPALPAEAAKPRRRRGRVLVPLMLVLVIALAAGGWWAAQGRGGAGAVAVPPPSATPHPSASTSVAPRTPSASPHPSSVPSSEAPTVTQGKAGAATPSRKPNVTLRSDLAFGFNSARLSAKAEAAIARVARQVRRADLAGRIYVEGYTDDLGSAAYGQVLSQRRADAVSTYLQSLLVGTRVSIVSIGHGESDPVADNATAAGRRANRRVTITLPGS